MHFAIGPKVFMGSESVITVQVCYITPQKQFLRTLNVAQGSTILQAIHSSGILEEFAELDLDTAKVGIYSKLKALDVVLKHRDRVEVYRSLQVDPMTARRARANKKLNR